MERAKLIVKNFGPLKDIEIEVRPMVSLIGAQASGKSTLAKLISIFEDDNFRTDSQITFKEELNNYNISNYLSNLTFIEYRSSSIGIFSYFSFVYSNGHFQKRTPVSLYHKLNEFRTSESFKPKESELIKKVKTLISSALSIGIFLDSSQNIYKIIPFEIRKKKAIRLFLTEKIKNKNFSHEDVDSLLNLLNLENTFENYINLYERVVSATPKFHKLDSLYIPSERNLLHLIAGNTMGLIKNNIQIPLNILNIGLEYEKAVQNVNKLPINIVSKTLKYKREGDTSYIYHNKNEKINLTEAASGIQTITPILLLVEYSKTLTDKFNFNFVIEEPELNLYPKAQYELIKYLVKNCLLNSKSLVLTTHSPFVLASINNLLLAYDKGQNKPQEVNKIVRKDSWINPINFISYELKNGKAYKISDDKLGQIKNNMIDNVSDFFAEEFDRLLDL